MGKVLGSYVLAGMVLWSLGAIAQEASGDIPLPDARPDEASGAPGTGQAAQTSRAGGPEAPGTEAADASIDPPIPQPRDPADVPQVNPQTSRTTVESDGPPPETESPAVVPALAAPAERARPPVSSADAARAASAIAASLSCEAALEAKGVRFETSPSVSEGRCGVLRPVSLDRFSNGLALETRTQMWCPTADALDAWMIETVVPAAKAIYPDRELTGIAQVSTYVCRNRNSNAKISEHARGSAVDIGAFVFSDGEVAVAPAKEGSTERRFLDVLRKGACGPFTTVLGPGTDADHAHHFHFDLAARKNPYCK
ncbi:extensin family protein [Fulvimarina endophytica]|uniref:Extensin family protein n=1 Tax=Fulvimarina endophytica TaxID=2293836 RepID=A0A371X2D4_9HYPH|nr:extensin family protein [Fulvimarina endophytica]RFC63373.1 extensin family protein [Fulvimarina endophytica]